MKKVMTALRIGTLSFVFFGNVLATNGSLINRSLYEEVDASSVNYSSSIVLIDELFPIIEDGRTSSSINYDDVQTSLIPICGSFVDRVNAGDVGALLTLKIIASMNTARLAFRKYLDLGKDDGGSQAQFEQLCLDHNWGGFGNEKFPKGRQIFALCEPEGDCSSINMQAIQGWKRPKPSTTEERRLMDGVQREVSGNDIDKVKRQLRKDISLLAMKAGSSDDKLLNSAKDSICRYEKNSTSDDLVKMLRSVYEFVVAGPQRNGRAQLYHQFGLLELRKIFLKKGVKNYCPKTSNPEILTGVVGKFGNEKVYRSVGVFFDSLEKRDNEQLKAFLETGVLTVEQLVWSLLSDPFMSDFDQIQKQAYLCTEEEMSAFLCRNFKEDAKSQMEEFCEKKRKDIDLRCLRYADNITDILASGEELTGWLKKNCMGALNWFASNGLYNRAKEIIGSFQRVDKNNLSNESASELMNVIKKLREETDKRRIPNEKLISIIYEVGDPTKHKSLLDYINHRTALYVVTEFILNKSTWGTGAPKTIFELCEEIRSEVVQNQNSEPSDENADSNSQSNPYSNLSGDMNNNNNDNN